MRTDEGCWTAASRGAYRRVRGFFRRSKRRLNTNAVKSLHWRQLDQFFFVGWSTAAASGPWCRISCVTERRRNIGRRRSRSRSVGRSVGGWAHDVPLTRTRTNEGPCTRPAGVLDRAGCQWDRGRVQQSRVRRESLVNDSDILSRQPIKGSRPRHGISARTLCVQDSSWTVSFEIRSTSSTPEGLGALRFVDDGQFKLPKRTWPYTVRRAEKEIEREMECGMG